MTKPPCGETCKKNCNNEFCEEERETIFKEFWKIGDINLQSAFPVAHVNVTENEGTRLRDTCKTKRRKKNHTRSYFFNNPTTQSLLPVCQKFFLNTLCIDEKTIRTALTKTTDSGTVEADSRGKHDNHGSYKERQDKVAEHTQLFKYVESHYVRKESKHPYLPVDLSRFQIFMKIGI